MITEYYLFFTEWLTIPTVLMSFLLIALNAIVFVVFDKDIVQIKRLDNWIKDNVGMPTWIQYTSQGSRYCVIGVIAMGLVGTVPFTPWFLAAAAFHVFDRAFEIWKRRWQRGIFLFHYNNWQQQRPTQVEKPVDEPDGGGTGGIQETTSAASELMRSITRDVNKND